MEKKLFTLTLERTRALVSVCIFSVALTAPIGGSAIGGARAEAKSEAAWQWIASAPKDLSFGYSISPLKSGKILIAGGTDSARANLSSAELFDPVAKRFVHTKDMSTPRGSHSATRLADGRILVVGGSGAGPDGSTQVLGSAEIYDPVAEAWSNAGSISPGRYGHTASLLADGRVLVAAGQERGHGPFLSDSWLFDPSNNQWSLAGTMDQGRADHTASVLSDGKVLIAGGRSVAHGDALRDVVLFDPNKSAWTAGTHLLVSPRAEHTALRLKNGRVLLIGGSRVPAGISPPQPSYKSDQLIRDSETFDPNTQRLSKTTGLSIPRILPSAVEISGSRILVTGGHSYSGKPERETGVVRQDSRTTSEVLPPTKTSEAPPAVPLAKAKAGEAWSGVLEGSCGSVCGKVLMVGPGENTIQALQYVATSAKRPGEGQNDRRTMFSVGGLVAILVIVGAVIAFKRRRSSV